MKKILVFILMSLFFLGCENNKSVTQNNTNTNTPVTTTPGSDNSTPQLTKLATPVTPNGLNINTSTDTWYVYYEPVKDVNGLEVPGAVIWTTHIKLQNPDFTTDPCAEYKSQPMGCGEGIVYTGNINIPNGTFCMKAVACADGYQTSDMMVHTVSVSNSSLNGDF